MTLYRFTIDGRPVGEWRTLRVDACRDAVREGYGVEAEDGFRLDEQVDIEVQVS